MCKEHVSEGPILRQMSEPLRLANFAAIRRKANLCRRAPPHAGVESVGDVVAHAVVHNE